MNRWISDHVECTVCDIEIGKKWKELFTECNSQKWELIFKSSENYVETFLSAVLLCECVVQATVINPPSKLNP